MIIIGRRSGTSVNFWDKTNFIAAFAMSLPESPRWLVLKGKNEQAMRVFAALNDAPEDSALIHSKFAAIKDTALAYVNQMFQQISGINLITHYIPNVLGNQVGLGDTLSKLIDACNGTECFLASWVAVFTVERFRRRQLMLFGATGMSISMIVFSSYRLDWRDEGGHLADDFLVCV